MLAATSESRDSNANATTDSPKNWAYVNKYMGNIQYDCSLYLSQNKNTQNSSQHGNWLTESLKNSKITDCEVKLLAHKQVIYRHDAICKHIIKW